MIPFPNKRYQIIYADPPWEMPNQTGLGEGGDVRLTYSTMTFQELKKLPIHQIADENCLLFLWVVDLHLPQCIEVGESWGFEYKTRAFTWDKKSPMIRHYTLSQVENCYLFKRGQVPKPRGKKNIRDFVSSKKGRNSEKPKEIRHRITEMFPTQPKIELFARPDWTDYDRGWDFWGNEVERSNQ